MRPALAGFVLAGLAGLAGLAAPAPAFADAPAKPTAPSKQASLVVIIAADGSVTVAGTAMTDDQLDHLFQAVFQRDKRVQVVFDVDDKAPHQRVVDLMDRAKRAGLTKFALATHKT